MKFWEAMKAMEEGKKVRRAYWEKSRYVTLDIFDNIVDNKGNSFNIIIDDKWELYTPTNRKEVCQELKLIFKLLEDACDSVEYKQFAQDYSKEQILLKLYTQLCEMNKYYELD